eukprot:TRINITY_DN2401_c0_g1_i1.p4 TRINITY_DN2401_c0_g1~~TRINITY_DN2401_c0_g1_i1.p4  ORF type:complete len:54 (+),score=10.75 TRINITY_DN2401_c0_g1_i1:496-657(+)
MTPDRLVLCKHERDFQKVMLCLLTEKHSNFSEVCQTTKKEKSNRTSVGRSSEE